MEYLNYLNEGPVAIKEVISSLQPKGVIPSPKYVKIPYLNYSLWPFQQRVLSRIVGDTLIVGLPTGLGKTYLAGAYLYLKSVKKPIRVLFLVPTVPLGVQQTLFARNMLNVDEAYFISGSIPPQIRRENRVWNAPFIVTTPQTFCNDFLSRFSSLLNDAKRSENPIRVLAEGLREKEFRFPFDVVIADECQRYIGETDGYSILLACKACGTQILALSATPQLHAPQRLSELQIIFDKIQVFTVDNPEIRRHIPERILHVVRVTPQESLLKAYRALDRVIRDFSRRINRLYGAGHSKKNCSEHSLCMQLMAVKGLKLKLVEGGASSVLKYKTWKFPELRSPLKDFNGMSAYQLFLRAFHENFNHKISAALVLLNQMKFEKAIVFAETVETVRQLGLMLQDRFGMDSVSILVGKGYMSMEQQASALLQFKERAKILVSTSVGEEGLDIPSADVEIWLDPPSNPKQWIQRFGRILRQPGDKKFASTYALVTTRTHEKTKLLSVKRQTEEYYKFTQKIVYKRFKWPARLPLGQLRLTEFLGEA